MAFFSAVLKDIMQQLGGPLGDIIETVPVRRQEKLLKIDQQFPAAKGEHSERTGTFCPVSLDI